MLLRDMLKGIDGRYAKTNDIAVKDAAINASEEYKGYTIETYVTGIHIYKGDQAIAGVYSSVQAAKDKIDELGKVKDADNSLIGKKVIVNAGRYENATGVITDLGGGANGATIKMDTGEKAWIPRVDFTVQGVDVKDADDWSKDAGKNGYVAFYNGKRVEVYADNKLDAQIEAAKQLGAKKHYDVAIELAEKNGEQVVIRAVDEKDVYTTGKKTVDVEGEISIKASEISKYYELKEKGYTTAWVGEGKICLAPPKKTVDDAPDNLPPDYIDKLVKRLAELKAQSPQDRDKINTVIGELKDLTGKTYDSHEVTYQIADLDNGGLVKTVTESFPTREGLAKFLTILKTDPMYRSLVKVITSGETKDAFENKIVHNYSGAYKK